MPTTTRQEDSMIECWCDEREGLVICPACHADDHGPFTAPIDSIELPFSTDGDAELLTCARCGRRIMEG